VAHGSPYSDQQLSVTFAPDSSGNRFHYFAASNTSASRRLRLHDAVPRLQRSLTGTRTERKEMRASITSSREDPADAARHPYDNLLRTTRGTRAVRPHDASAIGTNRRSEQELATITRGSRRARERDQSRQRRLHWNQYSHTTNANSLGHDDGLARR